MLQAIIFDVDGTLAETEELHRRAFNETFADQGLGWLWTKTDYHRLLKTTGGKERTARHMAEIGADPASVDIAALHRAKTARYVALMAAGEIALRPGIADIMQTARAAGLRLAIATTTSRPNVDALCNAIFQRPADTVFDVIAAGDEVAAKKPAPDVYLLALQRLGLPATAAIALEDSLNGLRSAKAAGLTCIVSPGDYTREEDLTAADQLIDSFPALLPWLHAHLPPA